MEVFVTRLRALIWKAYKVRLRSPFTTALDVAGPVVTIIIYLVLKVLMGALSVPAGGDSPSDIFSRPVIAALDPARDLPQYLCNKVLFYAPDQAGQAASRAISEQCGIELLTMSSGDQLVENLRSSLKRRIEYRGQNINLNPSNSSKAACFTLPNNTDPIYQAGIVLDHGHAQIYMTESSDNPVIQQPYTQGSTFNEYRFPQSDLNSGYYLLEICLANALGTSSSRSSRIRRQTNNNETSTNQTLPPIPEPEPTSNARWRIRAFPETATPQLVVFVFMAFQLAANLCNATATVMRIADNNESGLHHYIRSAGVPAGLYWAAQVITTALHMIVQSLIMATLLSVPASMVLCDPMFEANITIRWLLILTYSLALNTHAMFVGFLFSRTSHALLVTCLLAVSYAMYPLFFMLQWSPYAFSHHRYLTNVFTFSNPVSNYEALLAVMYSIYVQTNEPLSLGHLKLSIIGGGLSEWSIGILWLALVMQTIFWLLLTILIDQWCYTSSYGLISFPKAMLHELVCCNLCGPKIQDDGELEKSRIAMKTKTAKSALVSGAKSTKSLKKDPNRICCSLRNFTVYGPSTMMAYSKSDPLKLTNAQMIKLHNQDRENVSKTLQYMINRSSPKSLKSQSASMVRKEEPNLLEEAIQQHIVWQKSKVGFDNLNLDFRFNQVSFVLGHTDLKELFFSALMGLRKPDSGYVLIDGTKFIPNDLSLARRYIGHLSERDIFINEMTIFENLQFFGSLRDDSYTQYDSESLFVLTLLHLSGRKSNLPMILTSRSARKLSLAVAAVGHTKLLLLVEPTLSLHWRPRCQVLNLLKKYKSIRSIVVDTSDIDEATAFGDRVLLLKDGNAFLDGSPARLTRQLSCGYWIFFNLAGLVSPANKNGLKSARSPNENLTALERLTSDLFKEDKLQRLEVVKRPIYRGLLKSDGSQLLKGGNTDRKAISGLDSSYAGAQKSAVILKVRHSKQADQALCQLLKLFPHNGRHAGFTLAEITYESLEDILVLMMSKAVYPDLPPDLLLSLSYRTQLPINNDTPPPQVSVRKLSSDIQVPKTANPIFGQRLQMIIKDRLSSFRELFIILASIIVSLACVALALYALQVSLAPFTESTPATYNSEDKVDEFGYTEIERLFKQRIGLYIVEPANSNSNNNVTRDKYLASWPGNPAMTGVVPQNNGSGKSDAESITELVHSSRDLATSLIFYNPATSDTTLVFEPQLANAMISGIKIFNRYYATRSKRMSNYSSKTEFIGASLNKAQLINIGAENFQQMSASNQIKISRRSFRHSWHEMVHGHLIRRLFYGIGFAVAEGVAIGALVIAPVRHRSESRLVKVKTSYWLAMALFDLTISLGLVIGYLVLFIWIENTYSSSLLVGSLLVFLLYKFASLPIAYLVSLVAESSVNGFLFILLIYITTGWVFSIHLKTFVDWTLINEGYQYAIASWITLFAPISALIDAQTDLNHIGRMNSLCSQVPAYTATSNIALLDVPQKRNTVDDLLIKVRECLANGKNGISTNVINHDRFGIMWDVYLLLVFAIIAWTFLLFSEKFFGIVARRFFSSRTKNDPMKTIVRTSEPSGSLYKWHREKDRLISEYIRCINEVDYVKRMTANCIYLRVWLRPLINQSSIEKRITLILEPLIRLGQPNNEIHVELKTTLQIFIRLGTETNRYKVEKTKLIESYSNFSRDHGDIVIKFAIVDWTQEMLYKILLHGRYNTQSTI